MQQPTEYADHRLDRTKKITLSVTGATLFWAWGFAWAMNMAIYPGDPSLVMTAYVSSMATSLVTAIGMIFLSPLLSRSSLRKRVSGATALATLGTLLLCGISVAGLSGTLGLALAVCAGLLNGVALLFFTVLWGARYTVNGSYAGTSMAASFAFAFALNIIMGLLPQTVSLVALVLLVPLSSAIWFADERFRNSSGDADDEPNELSAGDQRLTVLPWKTLGILAMVSFIAVFFQAPADGTSTQGLSITFVITVVLCLIYTKVIWREHIHMHLRAACIMLFPLAVLALVLVVRNDGMVDTVAGNLLMSCAFFLHVVIWVQLIQTTILEGLSPIIAFGIGNIFVTAIQAAGLALNGVALNSGLATPTNSEVFAIICIVALVAGIALLLENEKETRAEGPREKDGTAKVSTAEFDEAVVRYAAEHGFSERETEVFSYLARGRNIPFIAEALVVTPGTVKAHSNHIYQKTQVNNRQQLIDDFEQSFLQ